MLGTSSRDPSTSWVPSTSKTPSIPIVSTQVHTSSNSELTKIESRELSSNASADSKSTEQSSCIDQPSTSQSPQNKEPSADRMTSSSANNLIRQRFTFRTNSRNALRLKRIASYVPQTLRKLGLSSVQVANEEPISVADVDVATTSPRIEEVNRREVEKLDSRTVHGPGGVGYINQPHPEAHIPNQPQRTPIANNSPHLANLLNAQPPCGPINPQVPPGQFSPYPSYPTPQTPHPPPGAAQVDPNQMAMLQQQQQQRMMQMQMQQQQLAQQHAQAQAAAASLSNASTPNSSTPNQTPTNSAAFFSPNGPSNMIPQNRPPNYPPNHPQMFHNPRMAVHPYPVPPQGAYPGPPHGQGPPMQGHFVGMVEQQEPVVSPPKKKRKPTKKQQKEAELNQQQQQQAQQAQQQAQAQQQQQQFMDPRMQPHMGGPMMGYPQPPGYHPGPPGYPNFPPGSNPQQQQQQQQAWLHMQQQRAMYQQQQQAQAAAAQAGQNGGQPWPPRTPVPYPPSSVEAPGSVRPPSSQRISGEMSQDSNSPANYPVQQAYPQHQMTPTFMRPGEQQQQHGYPQASGENPVDKLWNSQDDHLGDLGDLDDIEPMNELSGSGNLISEGVLLDDSLRVKKEPPSTPNGDRIDSSIASVVEMVSKTSAPPSQTSMPIVTQTLASTSTAGPTKKRTGNGHGIVQEQHQQQQQLHHQQQQHMMQTEHNPQIPVSSHMPTQCGPASNMALEVPRSAPPRPQKAGLPENGTVRALNGHDQQMNGVRRTPSTAAISEDGSEESINSLVKTLIEGEQRKKAADAENKAKQQRKVRRKNDAANIESSGGADDDVGVLEGNRSTGISSASYLYIQRQQLMKQQQVPPKQ